MLALIVVEAGQRDLVPGLHSLEAREGFGQNGSGVLRLLDQRELPFKETFIECRNAQDVTVAIRDLVVRGAPAIGIAAAWGVVLQAGLLESAGEAINPLRPS